MGAKEYSKKEYAEAYRKWIEEGRIGTWPGAENLSAQEKQKVRFEVNLGSEGGSF